MDGQADAKLAASRLYKREEVQERPIATELMIIGRFTDGGWRALLRCLQGGPRPGAYIRLGTKDATNHRGLEEGRGSTYPTAIGLALSPRRSVAVSSSSDDL